MRAFLLTTIIALGLVMGPTTDAQPSPKPNSAEIRLDDGSSVRMMLLVPAVEIETKYGRLVVPVADIRKIEFGLHVPAESQIAIDRSVKRLASPSHKERTTASADLLTHGHFAAPALRVASRAPDQETSTRAIEVLRLIGERVSADLVNLRDVDVIHTQDYPIHGKILATTLKATSPHFGEVALSLSGMRSVTMRHHGGRHEVTIDATKHGQNLNDWMDAGVIVDTDHRLSIQAEGQVDLWPQGPGQYVSAPKGYNTAGLGGEFMAGALIGRIGENGKRFLIAERFDAALKEEGRLYLLIVPSPWRNASSGGYKVRIQVDR